MFTGLTYQVGTVLFPRERESNLIVHGEPQFMKAGTIHNKSNEPFDKLRVSEIVRNWIPVFTGMTMWYLVPSL